MGRGYQRSKNKEKGEENNLLLVIVRQTTALFGG